MLVFYRHQNLEKLQNPFRKISKPLKDEYRMKKKIQEAGFAMKNSD
jgi:preprotein translocase subunit Sss1